MKRLVLGIVLALGFAGTTSAWAHHSYAMFDMMKVVEVKGTVKEFHYTNPHSWIVLLTRDASGADKEITLEANGPGYLSRFGWKRESLKPGDMITVSINPLRDGSLGGSLVKVSLASGQVLSALPPLPPGFAPPAPADKK